MCVVNINQCSLRIASAPAVWSGHRAASNVHCPTLSFTQELLDVH